MRSILYHPVEYYVDLLQQNKPFSFVGYSDAEWFSIICRCIGNTTGLGQILDAGVGYKLLDILARRGDDPRFMVAVCECIWEGSEPYQGANFWDFEVRDDVERYLNVIKYSMPFYARDLVLDDLAKLGGLFPLIQQFREMRPVLVGNPDLRHIDFLNVCEYVEIPSPNLHMDREELQKTIATLRGLNHEGLYLISAGISAALIIDELHDTIPNSTFFDCGSIWDAFVGCGGQRGWRRELYDDPNKLARWKHKCLTGEDLPNV